jgi:chitosanase
MGWDCGGTTVGLKDASGNFITVYCGTCNGKPGTWCQPNNASYTGVGKCGGNNPLKYPYQRQLINMLEAMGEQDTTDYQSQYSVCSNIRDGRGYTIGTVGFCTGTGDFIIVARCLNDTEPSNSLAKYWPGLVAIDNQFYSTNMNIGDTSPVDKIGNFCGQNNDGDVPLAGMNDANYRKCQDTIGDAAYMDTALAHAQQRGLQGALTIGFLYDTELNFGDDDDPNGVAGAKTVMKRADADYGPGLPTDFTGKPWEESRWLGFVIKERTWVMATDPSGTWEQDMDQNATWEVARRLHTGTTNNPESATDLSMDYDFVSAYKAGAGSAPCWPDLPNKTDAMTSIYDIAPVKTNPNDPSTWMGVDTGNAPSNYAGCPANPTP